MTLQVPKVIPHDWNRLRLIVDKLKYLRLGTNSSPTYVGMALTGLAASALVGTDASKALESVTIGTGLVYARPTLSLSDPLVVPGKLTAGSFASPTDVTVGGQYGFEIHYSGNDYGVTGIRSRAQLVTTDTTATAQGALLQAANNDNINAGVLQGALIEAIGKATTNAATIAMMRGCLINTEWSAKDTVTDLRVLHVRTHTRDAATEGYVSGTGYGIYIENEAVGGNGQALDAGIYFKDTNISGGNYAFTYGIDFSGGTFASEEIKLANGSVIGSDSIVLQPTTDSTTFVQIKDAAGAVVGVVDTVDKRWGFGTATPGETLEIHAPSARIKLQSESGGDSWIHVIRQENTSIASFLLQTHLTTDWLYGLFGDSTSDFSFYSYGTSSVVLKILRDSGYVGINETDPETLSEWTGTAPYLTLHNSTHEDADGGGESRLIFKREDGAGTETACFQFEASHDGAVANDQLGKGIWSVNTGSGLAEAMRLNSNIRLGIGVGSGLDPRGGLTVLGDIDILHTATVADDHAFEIDVDAAGYGDVKAIDINYITGTITAGEDEGIILINIDEIAATGGDIFGLEILTTEGAAGSTTTVYGLKAGVLVGPIHQNSGTFVNPAIGTNDTPQTPVANMIDGDSGPTKRTSIFVAFDNYIIIGATVAFQEIEFILTTGSSGAGIKPKFEYSTGGSGFTEFSPVDGTNGFRNTGVIAWDASDLTGHAVNADTGAANTYDIRITRERTNLTTSPILGYAKTAATTEYIWDKDGNVNIKTLTISSIAAEGSDVDKFLVDSSGIIKYRTGAQVLSDIGASTSSHNHSGVYEPADVGLTSLAGLTYASDSFIKVTATDTYAIRTIAETKTDLSLNLIENTALSTWTGSTNITTLGTITTVGNITIADGGTVGNGVQLAFDDTNDYLEVSGCSVVIGGTVTNSKLHIKGAAATTATPRLEIETQYSEGDGSSTPGGRLVFSQATSATTSVDLCYVESAEFATNSFGLNFKTGLTNPTSAMVIWGNGNAAFGTETPVTKLTVEGTLTLKEQAAADGDTAAYGQVWCKTATPNELWFTDDDGNDIRLLGNLSAYTDEDSETNALLKSHAYLAATDGVVSAYTANSGAYKILRAYVGSTDDPAGAGELIFQETSSGAGANNLLGVSGVHVGKGEYFEITYDGVDAIVIRWKSFGILSKPVDQD